MKKNLYYSAHSNVLNFMLPELPQDKFDDNEYIVGFVTESMEEITLSKGWFKDTNIQHVYVFDEDDGMASICYRNEGDPLDAYKGGFTYDMDEINTPEKALRSFTEDKEVYDLVPMPYEGDMERRMFETINVEILL